MQCKEKVKYDAVSEKESPMFTGTDTTIAIEAMDFLLVDDLFIFAS